MALPAEYYWKVQELTLQFELILRKKEEQGRFERRVIEEKERKVRNQLEKNKRRIRNSQENMLRWRKRQEEVDTYFENQNWLGRIKPPPPQTCGSPQFTNHSYVGKVGNKQWNKPKSASCQGSAQCRREKLDYTIHAGPRVVSPLCTIGLGYHRLQSE